MSVNYNDITSGSLVPIAGVPVDTLTSIQHNISRSSDEYSASKAYSVNDYCIHDNTLYRCKTACSAASWSTNSRYFEASSLTAAVTALNSDLKSKTIKTTTLSQTASNIAVGGYASLSYDVSSLGDIVSVTPIVKYTTWCLVTIETVSNRNTISVRVRNINSSQSVTAEVNLLIAYK